MKLLAWIKTNLEKERNKAKDHKEWNWPTAALHAHNAKILEEALPIIEAYTNTQSLTIAACAHHKCGKRYFDGSGKSKYCSSKCRVAAHKAKKQGFKYGWMSGADEPYRLYVHQNGRHWGVTQNQDEATVFPTIEACQDHYLSKHSKPEVFRPNLTNGYVKYYKAEGMLEVRPEKSKDSLEKAKILWDSDKKLSAMRLLKNELGWSLQRSHHHAIVNF